MFLAIRVLFEDVFDINLFLFSIDFKNSFLSYSLYHSQPPTDERTLSNDHSAESTYHLLALNHPAPFPFFNDQFCKLTYFLNNAIKISSISTIKANLKK